MSLKRLYRLMQCKHLLLLALGLFLVLLGVIWVHLPWVWSTIDDAGMALTATSLLADSNFFEASWTMLHEQVFGSVNWGLFRPSYWFYASTMYFLPAEILHLVRLIMFQAAILIPVFVFRREGFSRSNSAFSFFLITAAASGLVVGVFFLSLAELSGALFIAIGLAARRWPLALMAWLIAAGFKSPFAWILIGQAVSLWRQGLRARAAIFFTAGASYLAIAAFFAVQGQYTARYGIEPWRILANAANLVEVWTALILVSLLAWLITTNSNLSLKPTSVTLLIAFLGYTSQLLPWSTSGYYIGPSMYLLGLFLASLLNPFRRLSLKRFFVSIMIPIVIALYTSYSAFSFGLRANELLVGVNRCLLSRVEGIFLVSGHYDYVTTGEGVLRMEQNARMMNPSWLGSVQLADSDIDDKATLLCDFGEVKVWDLSDKSAFSSNN